MTTPGGGPGGLPWSEILRSRLAKQIGGVLAGVALMFAVHALYVAGMKGVGYTLARSWEENAGYPTLDRAYKRFANPDDSVKRAHNACVAQTATAGLDAQRRQALDMLTDVWVGEDLLVRFAAYIDCLTGERPSRFCRAADKEHLRHTVSDYFQLQTKVREQWTISTAGPFAADRMALSGGGAVVAQKGSFPSGRTDPRVIASLRQLIENGYVVPSDLGRIGGSFLPGDLSTALRGVEAKKVSCT